ncbi:hypothetical protein EV182_008047, partial [Spiromyces aspiralis]
MVTRHELTLIIDGPNLSLMPPISQRHDRMSKTFTFHMASVKCKRNTRALHKFKLIIKQSSVKKVFDLEAKSKSDANEIEEAIILAKLFNGSGGYGEAG